MQKTRKGKLPHSMHWPVYGAVRCASTLMPMIGVRYSTRGLREAGAFYGGLGLNRKRLRRAIDNIRWCFPDFDEATARNYAIESYRHLFSLAAEVCVIPRLLTPDGYSAHVHFGDMAQGLRMLLRGEPTILITGHCGSWELLGYTLAVLGIPVNALYRPLDMAPLDRWVHDTRSKAGLELIDKFGAAQVLPNLLNDGKTIGFIADQNAGDRGLFVPFFNRLASAYKTIGLLAIKFNAPIVCGHAKRRSGVKDDASAAWHANASRSQVFSYDVDVVDLIRPDDWVDQPDPLFYVTARYRRAIETMVRRAPEQYLWMHRYWKSRPAHERRGQPFPSRLRHKIEQLPWMTQQDLDLIVSRSMEDSRLIEAERR